MNEAEWLNAHGQDTFNTWWSIRQLDDFRRVLVAPRRTALVWFAVACLARIRHLLIPDAIHLLEVIEAHAEGRLNRSTVLEEYRAFLRAHYTPRIVQGQGGDSEIDIGEYDSTGSEAASAAAYLVTGDLIYPEDDRCHSTREQFWLAQGLAEYCRHTVMSTIPVVSWRQEELPPELEPSRVALFGLPPEQFRQLRRNPELNPTLYAAWQALLDAEQQSEIRRNAAWEAEELVQCNLVREVMQPPFVSCFSPGWRTSAVLALARGVHEERAFDRMPILADALQDAGCDSADILDHCRGPGPHVRGCWVVDLVLGKE